MEVNGSSGVTVGQNLKTLLTQYLRLDTLHVSLVDVSYYRWTLISCGEGQWPSGVSADQNLKM